MAIIRLRALRLLQRRALWITLLNLFSRRHKEARTISY